MADSPYPPYSGDTATCPKCGGQMNRKYQEAGTTFGGQGYVLYDAGAPEWMLRECFDCDWRTPEMCADNSD